MNIERELFAGTTGLSISIVVYRPDLTQLEDTLSSLGAACDRLRLKSPAIPISLCLVDNGGLGAVFRALDIARAHSIDYQVISGQGNVGYGRGHNLAIERVASQFHLVLNPDIDLDREAIFEALRFLGAHPEAGLLTPWIGDDKGNQQYLCRRYPTLVDLFVRGFAPAIMRRRFSERLARYEMRDQLSSRDVCWDPPIISGCFMLFRTEVLKELGGFDPRYFLYFEDYDLSLRTHKVARVAYVPSVRVVHHGGGASRKGFAHIRMFVASAFKFFNRFGWRWW